MAYDHGATDSGIKDDDLKDQLKDYFGSLDLVQQSLFVMGFIHARMHPPYAVEDMLEFIAWCRDELGFAVTWP